MAAEFRTKAGFECSATDGKKGPVMACFTDKELYPWMRVFQSDPVAEVLLQPKLTMLNGQQAFVKVSEQERFVTEYKVIRDASGPTVVPHHETVELGTMCVLRPTASADRQTVQLALDFRHTLRSGPVAVMPVALKLVGDDGAERNFQGMVQQPHVQSLRVKQKCTIPEGRTMAIAVGEITEEVRNETGPPVLRDIPFLRQVVTSVGYGQEQRELFLFVTPRVVISEVPEQVIQTELPPPVPRP